MHLMNVLDAEQPEHVDPESIWTALLALLLLKWLHFLSAAGWSLSNLASLLRLNLFTYRDLKEWLDKPLDTPPLQLPVEQLGLPFAGSGQLAA